MNSRAVMDAHVNQSSGPIFSLSLVGRSVVVINDSVMAAELLGKYSLRMTHHVVSLFYRSPFSYLQ